MPQGRLAWGAAALIGDNTLWRLAAVGLVWGVLVAPPLFYVLFTAGQRSWILDRIKRSGARAP